MNKTTKVISLIGIFINACLLILSIALSIKDSERYSIALKVMSYAIISFDLLFSLLAIFTASLSDSQIINKEGEVNDKLTTFFIYVCFGLLSSILFVSFFDVFLTMVISCVFTIAAITFYLFKKKTLNITNISPLLINIFSFVVLGGAVAVLSYFYGNRTASSYLTIGEDGITATYKEIYTIELWLFAAISLIPVFMSIKSIKMYLYAFLSLSSMSIVSFLYTMLIGGRSGFIGIHFNFEVSKAVATSLLIIFFAAYYFIYIVILNISFTKNPKHLD